MNSNHYHQEIDPISNIRHTHKLVCSTTYCTWMVKKQQLKNSVHSTIYLPYDYIGMLHVDFVMKYIKHFSDN